jgi:hypothetical protein
MLHENGGSDKDKDRLEQETAERRKLEQEAAEHRELERRAHRATVLSGLASAVALVLSAGSLGYTWTEANRRDRKEAETAAVQQYRSYLELLSQHPDAFGLDLKDTDVPGSVVLSSAEALYHLTEHDEGWRRGIKWMLVRHQKLLMKKSWDCRTFSEPFICFVKGNGPTDANFKLPCDDGTDPTERCK